MGKVTGQVFKVFEREWPSKRPGGKPNKTFSIKLEGDPLYYRCPRGKGQGSDGERFAGIAEAGNTVTFEAEPVNDTSAQIVGSVTKVEAQQATVASIGTGVANSAPAPAGQGTSREASIHYQSSRRDALAFVETAVRHGMVKMPAKEAARLEALEALVDHYTAAFFADVATFGAVARANGTGEPAEESSKTTSDEE
jgi:hypothetical protein